MTRSDFKGLVVGAVFGTMVGVLVGVGLGRILGRSADVVLTGRLRVDSASHEDGFFDNNRLLLEEAELAEPVYLTSETIDLMNQYSVPGAPIRLRGEFERLTLSSGQSVLQLEVKEVSTVSTPE
jgi:hypothetical protein